MENYMKIVDKVPIEIQKKIVYNFLLLREDILPSISVLVNSKNLMNTHPETLDEEQFKQFIHSITSAINLLEWCYKTYLETINPSDDRPIRNDYYG
ncbi:hypothetical protein [Herpetosiphon gulosus]|uniref:Uncharacterized protein n=1 Tax=Herpetosiphon gulosus TaxID=1973496 RepID=A0ABP9X790_9CHLR